MKNREHAQIYVGGRWIRPEGEALTTVTNPATGTRIGSVPAAGTGDVDRAVAAARAAQEGWARTPVAERLECIRAITERLRRGADQMAALITAEMGAPPRFARSEHVELPLTIMDGYLRGQPSHTDPWTSAVGNSMVIREPVGVVAAITPWNFPLYQLVIKVVPALIAGCTVVAKPSELTPLSTYEFAQMAHDAGLPAGVFNLVPGHGAVVGAHLSAHPGIDLVSFTGSTRGGVAVSTAAAAQITRVALELGGKSPSVVLPGADVAAASAATVASCFWNAGQTCSALTRLLVPRRDHDRAVAAAVEAARPLAPEMGPLISAAQVDSVQELIASGVREGARIAMGGPGRPENRPVGHYVRPTVFAAATRGMRIAQEEIFGPVLTVIAYDTVEEAVEIANDSPYGLAGAVWGADDGAAIAVARRIRAGQVDINGADFNPEAPFGGMKRSGIGRELGSFGLEEFFEVKAIQLPSGSIAAGARS